MLLPKPSNPLNENRQLPSIQLYSYKINPVLTSSKSLSAPPIETFSQVDATPVKSVKYINPLLDQTPRDGENKVVTSSSPIEYAKTPQIMKTPAVIRSSVKKPGEPVDFNNAEEVEQMLGFRF